MLFLVWMSFLKKKKLLLPVLVKSNVSCHNLSMLLKHLQGSPGKYVPLKETIRSFKEIAEGKYDHISEAAFLMVGAIEEVVEKAKKMGA